MPPPPVTSNPPKHVVHNDEPILKSKEDLLSLGPLVESIARTIANRAKPPFVASLNGDWGQGKTSVLRAVHESLTGAVPEELSDKKPPTEYQHTRVVWFEAWRYQHDPAPIVALLNEIRRQLETQSRFHKFKASAQKLGSIAIEASLLSLDDLGGRMIPFASAGGLVKNIQKVGNEWEQRNHAYALPSQTIRKLLDKAISDILRNLTDSEDRRLVVIIDDLDRCEPIVAYKLLEGLKIFLNLPSCAFLLGTNRREIERAIKVGLKTESGENGEGLGIVAREYFEKLCSYSWDIPFPTIRQTAAYVEHLLKSCDSVISPPVRTKLKDLLANTDLRLLPANPRRIKTFTNSLVHIASNATSLPLPDDAAFLLSFAYIATFLYDPTYRHLLANSGALRDLHTLVNVAYNTGAPVVLGEAVIKDENPFGNLKYGPDDIRYATPENTAIFRMAPVFATIDAILDTMLHKYLPHAR